MRRAVFPGSFDPVTLGHLHLIERASRLYDEVIVVIGANSQKNALFSVEERRALLTECLRSVANVRVDVAEGLLVDKVKELGADVIIDPSKETDIVQTIRGITPFGRGVDVAIDATGLPEVWEQNLYMVRKSGTVLEFGGCKGGSTITVDTTLLHYSQVKIKGVYHTTPKLVEQAFRLIERGIISEQDFVNDTYPLDQCLDALESHAQGNVIKNEIRCDQ